MNASSSRPRKQNPGQRVQGTKGSEGFSASIHRPWALHILTQASAAEGAARRGAKRMAVWGSA